MRRDFCIIGILLILVAVFYTNEIIRIDYNLNLYEYIMLSKEYTDDERAILEKYGTLTYGGNIVEPPLGKYYEDTGQYLGLVTDLIYALAIELETDIVMQPMVWDDALTALKNGDIDLCDLTPSIERGQSYLFTDRIYDLNGTVLKSAENTTLNHVSDLEGLRVGVQRGDYIIESIRAQSIEPQFIYTDNLTSALELLYTGQVEAVVGDEPVMKNQLNDARYVDNYEMLDEKVYESYVVLGLPKSHEALKPILNKAIFRIKKAGVLQKIQGKWLGTDQMASARRLNEKMKRNVFVMITLFVAVIYLVYAWNRNLKALVDDRTYELREITDELETILDNIKSTIILCDSQGHIKKTKGVIPGMPVNEHSPPSHLENLPFLHMIQAELKKFEGFDIKNLNHPFSCDIRYQNRIYECHMIPIEARDPLLLFILTDDTVERIQKAKLFHTNKMEAVGRLAAGIAHELRNPLGIVRNSTFILKDYEDSDADQKLAIEAIDRSIKRAGKIIENLLNYSRINESPFDQIDLKEILVEIMNYYRKSPENRKIHFSLLTEGDLLFTTSESAIRHIVTNLIGNGIDAMEGEGTLTLEAAAKSDQVVLKIKDTGKGIPAQDIENIFDPFFTTKPVNKGTGLGLYIVYSQIEKLEGNIHVRSTPQEGSTFTVSIPRTR